VDASDAADVGCEPGTTIGAATTLFVELVGHIGIGASEPPAAPTTSRSDPAKQAVTTTKTTFELKRRVGNRVEKQLLDE